jgi:nucleotide-binding universal stress UspA family protein
MERALAIVDASEPAKDLVREAGELAAGVDAELILAHITKEEDYEDRITAMESVPEASVTYSLEQAQEGGRQFARDVAEEVLADVDVDYEVIGAVGERAERILTMADGEDCDHIFMAGRKRSPTGKAVFGDATQRVILDYDGAVTVVTA